RIGDGRRRGQETWLHPDRADDAQRRGARLLPQARLRHRRDNRLRSAGSDPVLHDEAAGAAARLIRRHYSLKCAARQRTAAGPPSVAAFSRRRKPLYRMAASAQAFAQNPADAGYHITPIAPWHGSGEWTGRIDQELLGFRRVLHHQFLLDGLRSARQFGGLSFNAALHTIGRGTRRDQMATLTIRHVDAGIKER